MGLDRPFRRVGASVPASRLLATAYAPMCAYERLRAVMRAHERFTVGLPKSTSDLLRISIPARCRF